MKVAVVTGGSRGIGAATVTKFAKEGYTVIAVYNNGRQQAEAISAKLNDMGCDVHPMHADLSDPKQIADLFAQIGTYFKKIDVLVNNAAMSVSGLMQDIDLQTLDKIWAVNARAPIYVAPTPCRYCKKTQMPPLSTCPPCGDCGVHRARRRTP